MHPVLPKLKPASRVAAFKHAAHWDERGEVDLDMLADGLDVRIGRGTVRSIPDAWARPLLFEMALFDRLHPQHQRMLFEWRGLLAMLALKETLYLRNLAIEGVHIQKGRRFFDVLLSLAPSHTLPGASWTQLWVIRYHGEAIGMTSPTTLVCTAQLDHALRAIPWDMGLKDPATGRLLGTSQEEAPPLNEDARQALAWWLGELKEGFVKRLNGTNPKADRLVELISEFSADLRVRPASGCTHSPARVGFGPGLFDLLDRPAQLPAEDEDSSYVRLLPSRPEPAHETVLVLDRSIAPQWNLRANEVRVLPGLTLDNVLSVGGEPKTQPAGVRYWRSKDLFLEQLFVLEQANAFPGAAPMKTAGNGPLELKREKISPILPIRPELLDYLSPEDLADRVSVEVSGDIVKVHLDLPLSGPEREGRGRDVRLTKEFSADRDEIIRLTMPPTLEVWPNFSTHDWQLYYLFSYSSPETQPEFTFSATPYAWGGKSGRLLPEVERHGNGFRTQRMGHYPEAVLCTAKRFRAGQVRADDVAAGLLILKRPKTPRHRGAGSVAIGVDFGASGTNVYMRAPGTLPQSVSLESRCAQVVASGAQRVPSLYDWFLPAGDEKTPFQSIFRDFNPSGAAKQLEPVLDGHIYFLTDDTYAGFKANDPGVFTDLKWSTRAEDRSRVRAFLTQICLQASAEAVSLGATEIHWAYSFPTAFPGHAKAGLPGMWTSIVSECSKATGIPCSGEPVQKTESLAAALYFRSEQGGRPHEGMVCVDIGGSTADIAAWKANSLKRQASLRFAGRDMFLKAVQARPRVLRAFTSHADKLADVQLRTNPTAFYAQLDALVNREADEWFDRLPTYAGQSEVKGLIRLITFGIAGLFFYIGLLLRDLRERQQWDAEATTVFVGGKGSRLLQWATSGEPFTPERPVAKLFISMLREASGLEAFRLEVSHAPKAEAAYGLVCDQVRLDEAVDAEAVIAGEDFLLNGAAQTWSTPLAMETLRGNEGLPTKSLPNLERFFSAFQSELKGRHSELPPLPDLPLDEVRRDVRDTLAAFRGEQEHNILVEPLFVIGLRKLLGRAVEEWARE